MSTSESPRICKGARLPVARKPAFAPLIIGWLLLACAHSVLAGDDIERGVLSCERRLAVRLKSLLKWSADQGVSGFRHRLYELLIKVEPNHRSARKSLGYERSRTGEWTRRPDYYPPKDWDIQKLGEAEKRLDDRLATFRDCVLDLLEKDDGVDARRRNQLIERILEFMPDDELLRKQRGEVRHEGNWVLPETVKSRESRRRIAQLVVKLRSQLEGTIRRVAPAQAGGWHAAYESAGRSVVGTVQAQEAHDTLLDMEVAAGVARQLLGMKSASEGAVGPTYVMLVRSRQEALGVAAQSKYARAIIDSIQSVNAVVLEGGQKALIYADGPLHRRLAATRYTLDAHIHEGIGAHERGWLTEGLGQRLTWHLSSEHGISFASLRGTERKRQASGSKLPADPAQWLPSAADVLERDGARALARVLTARLNAMTSDDVLVSYGLAAFLLEARPDLGPEFMKATTGSHDAAALAKKHLGASLDVVTKRLVRWLREQA